MDAAKGACFFTPSGVRSASNRMQFASDLLFDLVYEDHFWLKTDRSGVRSRIILEPNL